MAEIDDLRVRVAKLEKLLRQIKAQVQGRAAGNRGKKTKSPPGFRAQHTYGDRYFVVDDDDDMIRIIDEGMED